MRRGFIAALAALAAVSLLNTVGCGGHERKRPGSTTGAATSGSPSAPAGSGTTTLPPPAPPVPGGPSVTTTTLPNAVEAAFYSETLTAAGGTTPYRWSLVNGSLPTGLTLDSFSGELSGSPQAPGSRGFTIRVTDDQGLFAEANLFLTVDPIGGAPGTGPGTGTPPPTTPPTTPPSGIGAWTDLPQPRLPQPLAAMACAAVNGIVYTFGGLPPQGLTREIQRLDTINGSISTAQVALPSPRAYMTAVTVSGKVYLLGGSDDSQIYSECFVFDPGANTLTAIASMPGERDSVAAAAVGTDIYVFGGATLDWATFQAVATTSIYRYDTVTNTWTTLNATLPQATQWALALSQGGAVYLLGGGDFEVDLLASTQTTRANYATVYAFDPATNGLTPKADLPVATKQLVGGVIGGQLYVCAGDRTTGVQNNAALWCQISANTYRYDPAADAWSALADFETDIPGVGRFGGRALAGGTAANNKLYLFGGYTLPTAGATAPPCPTQQGLVDGIAEFTP